MKYFWLVDSPGAAEEKYYLYYGNYFAGATGPKDSGNIYRFFDEWEAYDVDSWLWYTNKYYN